ncbi:Uncharacterised protein [Mycobacteroides abscessus subsp. abscessus]|nr:Uncharacterised protein [Mycobacteroides abscessus subsp. abscessus]SKU96609.1 Uncharacterised protein [Mycobacteroides abscessus subsp. abscessus]SLC78915.1 Uncharacterised protein [Mycobacteroides abscessus subsp. massiliense]
MPGSNDINNTAAWAMGDSRRSSSSTRVSIARSAD